MHLENILIVEDDQSLAQALIITLHNAGFKVSTVASVDLAKQALKNDDIELVISDIHLGQTNGLDLMEYIKKHHSAVRVIFMTAYGKVNDAVWAILHGASNYLTKPFTGEELLDKIFELTHQNEHLFEHIIQEDDATKNIVQLCMKVAPTDASVLLSGESGTGKEVFAKLIHDNSMRKNNSFIAINCAAIPDNMLEAILFGYEKGAFTGAYQTKEGKLELGNGGTLLLDEISEMPISLQAKLLRVIQEREVERLGGKKLIKLDIRIIATTNRNLAKEVEEGHFRKDLYFRLNVFPIQLPPLRLRKKDIIPLTEYFITCFKNKEDNLSLSKEAQSLLVSYAWPGNIRELQNVIQRAMIYSKAGEIHTADIHFENEIAVILDEKPDSSPLSDQLMDKENNLILKVLHEFNHNRNLAAEKLNISTRTLRNKLARMKKMGIIV